MQLVDNVSQAPKMYSVIGAILLAAFDAAVAFVPQLEGTLSHDQLLLINGIAAIGIAIARVIKQEGLVK